MKKVNQYIPYLIFIFIVALIGIFSDLLYPAVLNSNFVFALTTFGVGSLAIYIYIRQKSDEKGNSARILFLELRESEKELKKLIDYKITTSGEDYPQQNIVKLLQNRSWSKYAHLFIENFNNDEYQQLDEYFKKCDILEKYFEKQHHFFWISTEERARQKEGIGAKLAFDNPTMPPAVFSTTVNDISNLYIQNTRTYAPAGITIEINKQLEAITLISVTPLWTKLKDLASYTG